MLKIIDDEVLLAVLMAVDAVCEHLQPLPEETSEQESDEFPWDDFDDDEEED